MDDDFLCGNALCNVSICHTQSLYIYKIRKFKEICHIRLMGKNEITNLSGVIN